MVIIFVIKHWRRQAHEKKVFDKLNHFPHYATSKKLNELKLEISIKGCSVTGEKHWVAM